VHARGAARARARAGGCQSSFPPTLRCAPIIIFSASIPPPPRPRLQVREYWLCRQSAGLAVVLPSSWGGCRDEYARITACVKSHAGDEAAADAFRSRRLAELAAARAAAVAASGERR